MLLYSYKLKIEWVTIVDPKFLIMDIHHMESNMMW